MCVCVCLVMQRVVCCVRMQCTYMLLVGVRSVTYLVVAQVYLW